MKNIELTVISADNQLTNTHKQDLYVAALKKDTATFNQCLETLDSNTLQSVILQDENDCLLNMIARSEETTFINLIEKTTADAINESALFQDDDGNTFLHIAARYQSDRAFFAILDKIDPSILSKALLLQNDKKQTFLHITGLAQSEEINIALINKISSNMINEAVLIQDEEDGYTILQIFDRYQLGGSFTALINKSLPSAISKAAVLQDKNNLTILHLAIWDPIVDNFINLIDKIDSTVLNEIILLKKNDNEQTIFHMAAKTISDTPLMHLIDKVDSDVINKAALLQNAHGQTFLQMAAENRSEKCFLKILDKIDIKSLNQSMLLQSKDECNLLHTAAQFKSEKSFLTLLNKTDSTTISKCISLNIKNKGTLLHIAAEHHSETAFIALLDKMSLDEINQTIPEQVNTWTLLHYAATYQSEKAFLYLLNKAAPQTIDKFILLPEFNGWTVLHMAAQSQPENVCIALLDRITSNDLNQILSYKTTKEWTLLHLFAHYQSNKVLTALINKVDSKAISQASLLQNSDGQTFLHIAAQFQSKEIFIQLINQIDNAELNHIFKLNPSLLDYIIEFQVEDVLLEILQKCNKETLNLYINQPGNSNRCLLFIKAYQSPSLINKLLGELNNHAIENLLKKLNNYSLHKLPVIQSLLLVKLIKDTLNGKQSCSNPSFKTSHGARVSLDSPDLINIIMKEGFYSCYDAGLVIEHYNNVDKQSLIDAIKELDTYHLLFKGGLTNYTLPCASGSVLQEKIENYEVLYKMVKPEIFDNYITQFTDYTIRPNNLRITKSYSTHKFYHLTGEIKEYQPKDKHTCNKLSIKKNSTTLLSPEFITPVFGEQHNDGRLMVGLLFDLKQCNIKAMLKYDTGTVTREWVDRKKQVEIYKNCTTNLNYTDFTQFKQAIQHSPRLNEVLAEIPQEAILGIFMRDTRLKSKKTALDYANKIKNTLGIDLPIYHYSRVDKAMLPYPKERIEQHLARCPITTAQLLRESLLYGSYNLRFLGGKTYTTPDKSITKRLPQTAHDIVTKIDNTLAEGNIDKINTELDNIEKLLESKLNRSIKRTTTTANSYETTLLQLKNR